MTTENLQFNVVWQWRKSLKYFMPKKILLEHVCLIILPIYNMVLSFVPKGCYSPSLSLLFISITSFTDTTIYYILIIKLLFISTFFIYFYVCMHISILYHKVMCLCFIVLPPVPLQYIDNSVIIIAIQCLEMGFEQSTCSDFSFCRK